jgi:hypothetical protein
MTQKALYWVGRNRRPRQTEHRAGEFVAEAVRAASRKDGAVLAKVCGVLAHLVSEEFRTHCRAAAVLGGRLMVNVDAPSMVSVFAARWRQRLVSAIRTHAPRCGVRDVSFQFGAGGVPFEGGDKVYTNG